MSMNAELLAHLDDVDGKLALEVPKQTGTEQLAEDVLVRRVIKVLCEELLAKNEQGIRDTFIIPTLKQVVVHMRPYVFLLSILFLLVLVQQTCSLIFIILRF